MTTRAAARGRGPSDASVRDTETQTHPPHEAGVRLQEKVKAVEVRKEKKREEERALVMRR